MKELSFRQSLGFLAGVLLALCMSLPVYSQSGLVAAGECTVIMYGNPTCERCRSMMRNLDQAGISYFFYDVDSSSEHKQEMRDQVARSSPETGSVRLPVMVVNELVLINPSYAEVQLCLTSDTSKDSPLNQQPAPIASPDRWDESMYLSYSSESFYHYQPALERIDPNNIDHPLLQAALFYETNRIRAKKGLSELVFHAGCAQAAQMHAEDMVAKNFFDHLNPHDPSKRTPRERVERFGVRWSSIAENICYGDVIGSYLDAARSYIDWWMHSPRHKANIIDSRMTHLGTGAFNAGSQWSDANFMCVQVFARLAE